ncbi:hypothetical protein JFL43_03120 [Viridibacillus sp. YIM B01967]|uniref:Uncharacterized protein n=1 Tax=Viridibacillus soli TaxID=2798301 RepID=A0ABS1H382_9BACL|nr:hypothetical protein [Viridibacillus soli]MBK3493862.1 hypothetical protein [Viridibacillus soli]
MSVNTPKKQVKLEETKSTSRHGINVPPRNPNKRPTTVNMTRSIGRMKAEDRAVIQRSL